MPNLKLASSNPFPRIAIAHVEDSARSLRHRQQQLQRLQVALAKNKTPLVQTLQDDYNYSDDEALFQYSLALSELQTHYESLNLEEELKSSRNIVNDNDRLVRFVGSGLVYVIPHSGLYSVVAPLAAAMAAGNCVVIEVSLPVICSL